LLQGVDQFDVADAAGAAADVVGHGRVALLAAADRPGDGRAGADLLLPLRAGPAEELGEDRRGAAALGAVDGADLQVGQLDAGGRALPLVVDFDAALVLAVDVDPLVHGGLDERRAGAAQFHLAAAGAAAAGQRQDRAADGENAPGVPHRGPPSATKVNGPA